jgi:Spy/CpxP family protein refolding chaperone
MSATTDASNATSHARPSTSRRWTWLLALPLCAGLSISAAQAGQGHHGGRGFGDQAGLAMGGGGHHFDRLLSAANATDAQKAQIKAAWDAARPQLQTVRDERMKLHQQLQQALAAPTIDTTKVETLRRQSVQLMDKASAITTQAFVTSAQVLTPEQRQKVATALDQRHNRGEKPAAQ